MRHGRPGAVPAVERLHGEVLRRREFGHAVRARSDDRAHRAIGAERGRRQHLRAAMGEQRQQGGEGARETDVDRIGLCIGLCIDPRDRRGTQHPGGVTGAPEGGHHIAGRHRRAVMEARARPQREAPLQAVWRHLPASRQPRYRHAGRVVVDQRLGDLHAREQIAVAQRIEAGKLPWPDHAQGGQRLGEHGFPSAHRRHNRRRQRSLQQPPALPNVPHGVSS
ncbi:hypothetical protein D3C87_1159340 [compost metagenome]